MTKWINRRGFLAAGAAAGLTAAPALRAFAGEAAPETGRFHLRYAPHFGMFRHHAGEDPVDQITFLADSGFAAVEDSGLLRKSDSLLEKIRRELEQRGVAPGLFVAHADYGNPTFASGRDDLRRQVLRDVRRAADVAERLGARWCTVVPGKRDSRLPLAVQTARAIDTLRWCVEIAEPRGLVLLLEPIDHHTRRPHMWLHSLEQAHAVCRAVANPACRLLFDVYQRQLSGCEPLAALGEAWDSVGYIQVGDYPGRKEPGTGSIEYRELFAWLKARQYRGLVGMEHGNSLPGKPGELAVCAAYEAHDPR
jgi:hydroxypyruvate isomerase